MSDVSKYFPAIVSDLGFEPTDEQRKAKARLHAVVRDSGIYDVNKLTPAQMADLAGTPDVKKWLLLPGFKTWIVNGSEYLAKAEVLFHKVLDSMIHIAASDDPKSFAAKVNSLKLLADMLGYTNKKVVVRDLGAEIPKDEAELREYIRKHNPTSEDI